MKTLNTFKKAFLFLSFIVVAASACKKDDEEKEVVAGSATVTASLYGFDGASMGEYKSLGAAIVKIGPILNITSIRTDGKQSININLLGVAGAKEYDLDGGNAAGNVAFMFKDYQKATEVYSTQNVSSTKMIGGGKVNITKLTDTEAEGTFTIIAHDNSGKAAWVENGKFKGTITQQK